MQPLSTAFQQTIHCRPNSFFYFRFLLFSLPFTVAYLHTPPFSLFVSSRKESVSCMQFLVYFFFSFFVLPLLLFFRFTPTGCTVFVGRMLHAKECFIQLITFIPPQANLFLASAESFVYILFSFLFFYFHCSFLFFVVPVFLRSLISVLFY